MKKRSLNNIRMTPDKNLKRKYIAGPGSPTAPGVVSPLSRTAQQHKIIKREKKMKTPEKRGNKVPGVEKFVHKRPVLQDLLNELMGWWTWIWNRVFTLGLVLGFWRSICHIVVELLKGIILLDIAYYTDSHQVEAILRNCSKFIIFLTFRFLRQKGITKVKACQSTNGQRSERACAGRGPQLLIRGSITGDT